jgi:hypothetical protein
VKKNEGSSPHGVKEAVTQLLSSEYAELWARLLGGYALGGGDAKSCIKAKPSGQASR